MSFTHLLSFLRSFELPNSSRKSPPRSRRGGQPAPVAAMVDVLETRQMYSVSQLGNATSQLQDSDTLADFTVPAGVNRLLVVTASNAKATDITGVTFNGQALTQAVEITDDYVVDSIWVLPMGSDVNSNEGDIVVTSNSVRDPQERYISAVVFQGVDQTTPTSSPRSSIGAVGDGSSSNLTVTSDIGDYAYDAFDVFRQAFFGGTPSVTTGAGQTLIATQTGSIADDGIYADGVQVNVNSGEPGASSVIMSHSTILVVPFAHVAINIEQAANVAPIAASLQNTTSTLPENTSVATRIKMGDIVLIDDGNGENNLRLSGPDETYFEIEAGVLYLRAGVLLDFESKNQYDVTVEVDDATVGSPTDASVNFTLSISDVNDAPTVALQNTTTTLTENTSTATRIKVGDIVVTDDGLGTNDVTLSEADIAHFEIEAGVLYLKAGTVLDFETKNQYDVTVDVDDATLGSTPDASVNFTLSISDVNESPTVALQNTITTLAENTSTATRIKVGDIVVTDDGLGTNDVTLSGADIASFEIEAGVLYLKAGTVLDHETKNQYDITVEVDDATLGSTPEDSANFTLTVTNVNEGPVLAGAVANQAVNDNATINPFATMTVTDPDTQAMSAIVVINNGVFRGDFTPVSVAGWKRTVIGNSIQYAKTFSSAPNIGSVVQTAIQQLVFQPRNNAIKPNTTEATAFTVTVTDGIAKPASNNQTSVITTSVNDAPVIGGASSSVVVNDNATVNPFTTLTVTDADMQETLASVTILNGVARGDFINATSSGWTVRQVIGNNITYKRYFSPGANVGATVQAAIRDLVFQPRNNAIKPGTTELTDFQVTVSDGVAPAVLGTGTRVTTTSVNDTPVIGGTVANQPMNDNSYIAPFSTVTVTDPDQEALLVRVTINNGVNRGDIPTAPALGWTRKVVSGNIVLERYFPAALSNAATVQNALCNLVFQPRSNVPLGTTETTNFTLYIKDGSGTETTDTTTSIITTGVAPRPIPVALQSKKPV